MKYVYLFLAMSIALVSCKSQSTVNTASDKPFAQTNEDGILVGQVERRDLEDNPVFEEWYKPMFASYRVDESKIDEIKKNLKGVDIQLFMGTWCGDSKRETPRFFKILDAADYTKKVDLITVTRAKNTPNGLEEGLNITNVPTIIFKKNGKELGRIVEYPIISLESDMLKILTGQEYKHAYAE